MTAALQILNYHHLQHHYPLHLHMIDPLPEFTSSSIPQTQTQSTSEPDDITAIQTSLRSPFCTKSDQSRIPPPSPAGTIKGSSLTKSRHKSRESFSSPLPGGFRTLIVDDNIINLNILERTLKRHFSHLVSPNIALASSGDAALSQLVSPAASPPDDETLVEDQTQYRFDLILLDIDMPGLSGIEVAEQIRNVHNDQATAIVAVTTSTLPEQRRSYEKAGMDGCVGKPIDVGVLDRVVTRALLARRPNGGRPRRSSVPPSLRELVAVYPLQFQLPGSSAMTTAIVPTTDGLPRRSSFPLSIEELNQMRDAASVTILDDEVEKELVESVREIVVIRDGKSEKGVVPRKTSLLLEHSAITET